MTAEAGLAFTRTPHDGYHTLADRMSGGVCVLDVDGVPPLDLFFAVREARDGTRSHLFVGHGPLDYVDETDALGLREIGDAIGCLAVDADGDGDQDLFVSEVGALTFYRRDDAGFVDATGSLELSVGPTDVLTSIAAGDLDGDADLDLVVAGFIDDASPRTGDCGGIPCPLVLTEARPVASHLLLHEGERFVERTAELAPDLGRLEPTLVVAILDLDDDGLPEIFVGNDLGATFHDRWLERDGTGVFRDQALDRGLSTDAGGHGIDTMGVAIGDVNGDGLLDVAETSFEGLHSPIFLCGRDGFCEENGRNLGLGDVRRSLRWANALVDLDLDGDLDLLESAGHVYLEEEGAPVGVTLAHDQRPNVLVGRGDGSFVLVMPEPGDATFAGRWPGRGAAVVDLDDDGRMDFVMATTRGAPAAFRNVRSPLGHWLRIVLRGRAPNTGGVGARIEVDDGERVRIRSHLAGEGYLGNHDARVHVGLPSDREVDVRVRWPSGAVSTITRAGVDRELVVGEP